MDTVTPERRGFGLEFRLAINTAQTGEPASEGEHEGDRKHQCLC